PPLPLPSFPTRRSSDLSAGDRIAWQAERRQADAQQAELAALEQRADQLTLSAPLTGACLTPTPRALLGRAVTRGEPLAVIGETSDRKSTRLNSSHVSIS